MSRRLPVLVLLAAATLAVPLGSVAAPPAAAVAAPEVALGSVLRPAFTLADGKSFEAGTAFAAEFGGETLVLTAFHLFGPVGGLPAQIAAPDMPTAVKKARFLDAWGSQKIGADVVPVAVPGAHPMGDDATGDLAVFHLPPAWDRISAGTNPPFHGLVLAGDDPKVGDRVWLAAPVLDDPAHVHAATVVEVKPIFLFYAFDGVVELRATSGGPVLNQKGEVVGIHLGGGLDGAKTIGAAGPVSAIRKNLAAAVPPRAPAP